MKFDYFRKNIGGKKRVKMIFSLEREHIILNYVCRVFKYSMTENDQFFILYFTFFLEVLPIVFSQIKINKKA